MLNHNSSKSISSFNPARTTAQLQAMMVESPLVMAFVENELLLNQEVRSATMDFLDAYLNAAVESRRKSRNSAQGKQNGSPGAASASGQKPRLITRLKAPQRMPPGTFLRSASAQSYNSNISNGSSGNFLPPVHNTRTGKGKEDPKNVQLRNRKDYERTTYGYSFSGMRNEPQHMTKQGDFIKVHGASDSGRYSTMSNTSTYGDRSNSRLSTASAMSDPTIRTHLYDVIHRYFAPVHRDRVMVWLKNYATNRQAASLMSFLNSYAAYVASSPFMCSTYNSDYARCSSQLSSLEEMGNYAGRNSAMSFHEKTNVITGIRHPVGYKTTYGDSFKEGVTSIDPPDLTIVIK